MLDDLISNTLNHFPMLLGILQAIVNLAFAGAVAKDSGRLYQLGQPTILVSGIAWAFATLIGGVFIACAYWLIHYSNLTRVSRVNFTEQ